MSTDRPTLLAAIARRLWRDLGFADPDPEILRFLPMLCVAWSDNQLGEAERDKIAARAEELPDHLQSWLAERLKHPPGPYFRYQVAHLLAFLLSVWPSEDEWAEEGEQWANELIQEAGWLKRLFGRLTREERQLGKLRRAMEEAEILASDRIWALARGHHAEFEPRHATGLLEDGDQVLQAIGITLDGPGDRVAVATRMVVTRDEDLVAEKVIDRLARSAHLREPERWILVGGLVYGRGRPPTARQLAEVDAALQVELGCPFELINMAEMAYLEDALAVDARWMSWVPGKVEALRIDREQVVRRQAPGTFCADRADVHASVAQQLVAGPSGLGFRILEIVAEGQELRLASPVILREPATQEAVEWIARFLPAMCDPCQQLVLDPAGPSWIAEVTPKIPTKCTDTPEPLPKGRALLVPPWVWFRAAGALGVRYFSGKRRSAP